jgi:hypothetical protein
VQYQIRPVSDRSAFTGPPEKGTKSPFKADLDSTMRLLDIELRQLEARSVVIEVDVGERGLRYDGTLRKDAKADHPGVRLAFESRHGSLIYACDRFGYDQDGTPYSDGWQENLRAIALGLEALRKVERYGIGSRGEQYRGYGQLPAGTGIAASGMTYTEAIAILLRAATGGQEPGEVLLADYPRETLTDLLRAARRRTSPDVSGDEGQWYLVDRAAQVLQQGGLLPKPLNPEPLTTERVQ